MLGLVTQRRAFNRQLWSSLDQLAYAGQYPAHMSHSSGYAPQVGRFDTAIQDYVNQFLGTLELCHHKGIFRFVLAYRPLLFLYSPHGQQSP